MKQARILVVDDNQINLELVSFLLGDEEVFAVETADNAVDALARVPQFLPDLILMDIQLPGMDGLTLTGRLKADPATAHIVIVAFTAYAMKGDEARMRQAGCDAYISKPIEVASFVQRIRACLLDRPT